MLKNRSYQSGKTLAAFEDGVVRVKYNGKLILEITGDEFLDFWYTCGKLANDIASQSPTEMGWQPDSEAAWMRQLGASELPGMEG